MEFTNGKQVQRCNPRLDTLRPGQPVGNWRTHVRASKLGENGTVRVLYHGMDNTLRMNVNLNPVWRGIEQPTGLNQLQPFVHERGGVDRNLLAHRPVRVRT